MKKEKQIYHFVISHNRFGPFHYDVTMVFCEMPINDCSLKYAYDHESANAFPKNCGYLKSVTMLTLNEPAIMVPSLLKTRVL